MDPKAMQEIIGWARGTDLLELAWQDGSQRVEFRLEGAPPNSPAFPSSPLLPVPAPGVGIFRWSSKGAPRRAEEGKAVSQGELLGIVETADEPLEVRAPAAGKLVKILVDDGKAVEYGQGLFLIHP